MRRKDNAQLNIRSDYARERVDQLVRETGKSARQVVEEAVRAYRPPPQPPPPKDDDLTPGMVRKGRLVVWTGNKVFIPMEATLRAIEESRTRDIWGDDED